jgi:hypothetical protein
MSPETGRSGTSRVKAAGSPSSWRAGRCTQTPPTWNKLNIGASSPMWSRLPAIRAGFSDRAHDLVQRGDAGFRRGAGERMPPGFLPRSGPRVRIGPVLPVSVMLAFCHRALFHKGSERPSLKGPVRWTGRRGRRYAPEIGFHGRGSESISFLLYTTPEHETEDNRSQGASVSPPMFGELLHPGYDASLATDRATTVPSPYDTTESAMLS